MTFLLRKLSNLKFIQKYIHYYIKMTRTEKRDQLEALFRVCLALNQEFLKDAELEARFLSDLVYDFKYEPLHI